MNTNRACRVASARGAGQQAAVFTLIKGDGNCWKVYIDPDIQDQDPDLQHQATDPAALSGYIFKGAGQLIHLDKGGWKRLEGICIET